jgi:DNA-binding NarL/FixJ family response regulator
MKDLSTQERECLTLLRQALPNAEIAERMNVPVTKVKALVKSLMHKLDAANRTQVMLAAMERDL